jgi:hypothetical protein
VVNAAGDDAVARDRKTGRDYGDRARSLREDAAAARERFVEPANPPDRDQALAFARDGVGEAAAIYIEARTERSWVSFDTEAFDALETGLNTYLALFAACHGVTRDPDVSVRTAAETLLDTHDAVDTAAVLTDVDA